MLRRIGWIGCVLAVLGVGVDSGAAKDGQPQPTPSTARPDHRGCFGLRPVADVETGNWRGQTRANHLGIAGHQSPTLWDKLDEAGHDPHDNAMLVHDHRASELEVRLAALHGPTPRPATVVLRVAHRGDFEDATPGFAQLRQGHRVIYTMPLSFGSVPFGTTEGTLPADLADSIRGFEDLRVRIRSKADSPTRQDLSIVSQVELLVCPG